MPSGHCTVRPAHRTHATKQLYLPDTAVLVTRFMTEAGAGEVLDFMPVTGTTTTSRHRLVRLVRCVRGSMTFQVEIAPRFDYGRRKHELHITPNGAAFAAEDGTELNWATSPRRSRISPSSTRPSPSTRRSTGGSPGPVHPAGGAGPRSTGGRRRGPGGFRNGRRRSGRCPAGCRPRSPVLRCGGGAHRRCARTCAGREVSPGHRRRRAAGRRR
ncbi:trehalase-like domain-containing protein [Streptomyces sp. NPDC002550]